MNEEQATIQIEFEPTLEEYVQFYVYHVMHDKAQKKRIRINQLAMPVVIAVIAAVYFFFFMDAEKYSEPMTWLPLVVFLIVGAFLSARIIDEIPEKLKNLARKAIKAEDIPNVRTLRLEEAGLANETPGARSVTKYEALREMVRDKKLTYVYVSSASAVVVPDRAFADAEERAAFFTALKSRMEE